MRLVVWWLRDLLILVLGLRTSLQYMEIQRPCTHRRGTRILCDAHFYSFSCGVCMYLCTTYKEIVIVYLSPLGPFIYEFHLGYIWLFLSLWLFSRTPLGASLDDQSAFPSRGNHIFLCEAAFNLSTTKCVTSICCYLKYSMRLKRWQQLISMTVFLLGS